MLNQTRILFWGIQRSGNHALINWILAQCQEPKMFLNNQPFGKELKASAKHFLATYNIEHSVAPRLDYVHKAEKNWLDLWRNPTEGTNKLLLVSFENHNLSQLSDSAYHQGCKIIDSFLGKSAKTINVVLLRDAFNMWIKDMPYPPKPHNPELWKAYAKEYLGETDFLPDKVTVNYNRWFIDRDYRQSISKQLGLLFSDCGLNQVTDYGGGSNFDGTSFDGNAQLMNVLNRWESSKNRKNKRRLFKILRSDSEMSRLLETIYPDLYQKWNRATWDNFWYYYI